MAPTWQDRATFNDEYTQFGSPSLIPPQFDDVSIYLDALFAYWRGGSSPASGPSRRLRLINMRDCQRRLAAYVRDRHEAPPMGLTQSVWNIIRSRCTDPAAEEIRQARANLDAAFGQDQHPGTARLAADLGMLPSIERSPRQVFNEHFALYARSIMYPHPLESPERGRFIEDLYTEWTQQNRRTPSVTDIEWFHACEFAVLGRVVTRGSDSFMYIYSTQGRHNIGPQGDDRPPYMAELRAMYQNEESRQRIAPNVSDFVWLRRCENRVLTRFHSLSTTDAVNNLDNF